MNSPNIIIPAIGFFIIASILALLYIRNIHDEKKKPSIKPSIKSSIKPSKKFSMKPVEKLDHKNVFKNYYDTNMWEKDEGVNSNGGGSGPGSDPKNLPHTVSLMKKIINERGVDSMLDAACGAMKWQDIMLSQLNNEGKNLTFKGVDIVPSVIEKNVKNNIQNNNISFGVGDITDGKNFPKGYDLVLVRDVLMHLPYKLAIDALENVAHSGAKYALIGSHPKDKRPNKDITVGQYYEIDVAKHPFNITGIDEDIDERILERLHDTTKEEKHLYLYDVENYLKHVDFNAMRKRAGCN